MSRSNLAPILVQRPQNSEVTTGSEFSYTLPESLFLDPNGDNLFYTITLIDGSALPSWISFDEETATFSGTSPSESFEYKIKITATDSLGFSNYTFFEVSSIDNLTGNLIEGDDANNTITGTSGDDIIYDGLGRDTVNAGNGNDIIYLQGGDNISGSGITFSGGKITSATGAFWGGSGNDTFVIEIEENQTSTGGLNVDGKYLRSAIIDFDVNNPNEKIDLSAFTNIRSISQLRFEALLSSLGGVSFLLVYVTGDVNGQYITLAGVEESELSNNNFIFSSPEGFEGSSRADKIYGDSSDNEIYSLLGNDLVFGYDGEDLIFGAGGNDTIYGGNGNDALYGDEGNDKIYGEGGDDYVYGGSGNNVIYGGVGSDRIDSGEGNDKIYGEIGNDYIDAGAGNNIVYGGDGNDLINSYFGNDSIYGDAGNDTINSEGGNNKIYGGEGDDQVLAGSGKDRIYGGNGADSLISGAGDDMIYGDAGNDTISSEGGNNRIYGGDGDDTIVSGTGIDRIYGGNGQDIINSGDGNDLVYGDAGNDTILGGTGNDVLYGGIGNDILVGEEGKDTLYGGKGIDYFAFTSLDESTIAGSIDNLRYRNIDKSNLDLIMDFKIGEDKIDISVINDSIAGTSNDLDFNSFDISIKDGNTIIKHIDSDFAIDLKGKFNLTEDDFIL